jgi:NADH-quinone oxidoreductase subunit L
VVEHIETLALITLLSPLLGSLVAGLLGKKIGRKGAHCITIGLVAIAFISALSIAKLIIIDHGPRFVVDLYTWGVSGTVSFKIGILLDGLSAMMIVVVTFVSLFVHVYSVGYMQEDQGYQRFFSYVSLFTFAMLCLVMANDFVLLFFGWEGVGVVSYLLIGFWFHRETAVFGSLKAFIVNRVGDFGFLIAIAALLTYFKSLDFLTVFAHAPALAKASISVLPGVHWSVMTMVCLFLVVGAAGKSAQVPLHVWLPESMEGPTPISALIHAATMVTAGIYMICRMSPLFQFSQTAMTVVIVLGGTTCLFMGILGVVQQDIKRVIAYSTLSQLGYMMAAVGASAYAAGMFHLFMHAFFKALLFLAAGSVIIGMHHEQDMRKMGGLKRYMPITYITFLIGALSLSAIPPFSGFYSKDSIIEAVGLSTIPGAAYAYYCVLAGAFVTPLYIFRGFFLTFHGKEKFDEKTRTHLKESRLVVLIPLMVLAIPSVVLGALLIKPLLYAVPSWFGPAIVVPASKNVLAKMDFTGVWAMTYHAFTSVPFWLSMLGVFTAWYFNYYRLHAADQLKKRFSWVYAILQRKYGFDDFNQIVLARGSYHLGNFFFKVGDLKIVDGFFVNGSGRLVLFVSRLLRYVQSGYLYHYTFAMVLGLLALLLWI